MYKIRFIIFTALFLSLSAAGRQDFVVTQAGDTLNGKVSFQMLGKIEQVQVKGQTKESISAIQVRMAAMKGKFYRPVQFSGSVQMMEIMIDGYLSLLAFRPPSVMSYDGRLLLMRDGRNTEVPSIGFKKYLSSFLNDSPELSNRIKEGELARTDIEKIVTEYNAIIEKNTQADKQQSVVAEKQKSKIEILNELQTEIEQSDIESKKDLLEMLNEVKDKISNDKAIPTYLSNSLKEGLKSKAQMAEKLERFLKSE
jgi:hypothetical protein